MPAGPRSEHTQAPSTALLDLWHSHHHVEGPGEPPGERLPVPPAGLGDKRQERPYLRSWRADNRLSNVCAWPCVLRPAPGAEPPA